MKMELYLALTDFAVTSSTGDGQLFRALKPLVQRKDDEEAEWSSQKGPQRGTRWRTRQQPPAPQWKYNAGYPWDIETQTY